MKVKMMSTFDTYKCAYPLHIEKMPACQDLIVVADQLFLVLAVEDDLITVAGLPNEIKPLRAWL